MLLRREWRLPGPSCADDRGRRPFVAPDAYSPQMSQPSIGPPGTPRERVPLPSDAASLPELGEAFASVLEPGLRSLDVSLTPGAAEAIDAQARLLLAWNEHINLTAIRTPDAIARLHVLDSLSAVPILRDRLPAAPAIVDLGSGAGYPGLPLAVALPAGRLSMVESVAKKVRFLEAVAGAAGRALADDPEPMPVEAIEARAEQLAAGDRRGTWDVATVRAVGTIAEVVELGLPLLRRGGVLVCWKRERPTDDEGAPGPVGLAIELREARSLVTELGGDEAEVVRVESVGLTGHRLVIVHKARPTPRRYPRPPAERRRRLLR
jgi:16S rRNA (guanine527-N7)-methyltransferase